MNPSYARVARRANHRCEYCNAPEAIFNFPFEVEHITPKVRGGADDDANLALACRSCNLFKSNLIELEHNGKIVRLFHPRLDDWEKHFAIETATAEIVARTEIAEVTITCLRMNSENQLLARLQWVRLGLFP